MDREPSALHIMAPIPFATAMAVRWPREGQDNAVDLSRGKA